MEGTVASVPPQGGRNILNRNFYKLIQQIYYLFVAEVELDKLIDEEKGSSIGLQAS